MSPWKWQRGRFAWSWWEDTGDLKNVDDERWVRVVFGLWLRCRQ